MTLKELKENVLKMIEEISETPNVYTDDPDIDKKLNTVINQVMYELARMKKIPELSTLDVETGDVINLNDVLDNFYQLDHVKYVNSDEKEIDVNLFGSTIECTENGTISVYYYKYPTRITENTNDTKYKFELSEDALEILPYGVAADLLKSDVSANYGQIYSNRYETMLQRLDPRYGTGMIFIDSNGVF